ncbi:MAG: hypothetical protein ACTSO7_16690 [Candidatus Heimdallarchaeota archaeon]
MKLVLFDTNVYLALIFPLDTWKAIVEKSLSEVNQYVKKNEARIVCVAKIIEEINNNILRISNEINNDFSCLYDEINEIRGGYNKENVLKFRKIMEHQIFETRADKDRKNRLFYIEELILQEFSLNDGSEFIDVYYSCAETINELVVRFKGEIAKKIRKYSIKLIEQDEISENAELNEILENVSNSVRNSSDAEILSQFIFYLKKKNLKGIFVTHDFRDLLLNSIALESLYDEIYIVRPAYVKCLMQN